MLLPKYNNFNVVQYKPGQGSINKKKYSIKLSANESALGPSPKAMKAYLKDRNSLSRYPDNKAKALRLAISKKYNLDFNRIICGSGSDEIIQLICNLFLKRKDEVIVTKYSFIMYRIYSKICGGKVVFAKEKNFKASVKEILQKVSNKTKIVFIANPNNPTGTYLTKNELIYLRSKLRENILLVIDDAYCEYMGKKDYKSGLDLFRNKKNVIITRTFSKIFGLAGLRLGWGYSSKKIIDQMYKIKPPFNVNRSAISAGKTSLMDKKWIKKSVKYNDYWKQHMYDFFRKNKIITNKPSANFFLLRFNNQKFSANYFFKKLIKKGIILRPMNTYGIFNALRITIGNKRSNMIFLREMKKILKNV